MPVFTLQIGSSQCGICLSRKSTFKLKLGLMMRHINNALLCLTVFVLACLYSLNGHAHSQSDVQDISVTNALHWLEEAQVANGSVISSFDLANEYQTTSEALNVYSMLNSVSTDQLAASAFVANAPQAITTEGLVRTLIAFNQTSKPYEAIQTELLSRQNTDGGFGEFAGYGSNVLDTSFALLGLQNVGGDTAIAGSAISFLILSQASDGSFTTYFNNSSVVVTAMVLRAIRSYSYTYNISSMVKASVEFLYKLENNNGWGESYWETALALSALIPVTTDVTRYHAGVDFLRSGQSTSGDWDQSVYTTALAAYAIGLLNSVKIPADPDKAVIAGTVIDASNRTAISGVKIELQGSGSEVFEIASDGKFTISNIDPDTHVISYSAPGYSGASQSITVTKGQFVNIGTIVLNIAPTTALITGTVTDESGNPIVAALISSLTDGISSTAVTDANGAYQLVVSAGQATIEITATDYRATSASAELVAGSELRFSPSLARASEDRPLTSTLFGIVLDDHGLPIEGVVALLSQGASVVTDASGLFEITGLTGGEVELSISKEGYKSVGSRTVVPERTNVNIGAITLRIEELLPVSSVFGRVLDVISGTGVSAATVVAGGSSTTTDNNGYYRIEKIALLEFSVGAGAVGFLSAEKQIVLAEHSNFELNINLRQANLGNVTISDVSTDKVKYNAYDSVYITASVTNDTAVMQGVRLFAKVTNVIGDQIAEFSGYYIPPLDPQSGPEELAHYQQHFENAVEGFEPNEHRTITLEQWWNTIAIEPGVYTITVQAFDSFTSSLVSERSTTVEVESSRSITLNVKTNPPYVLLNNSADVEIYAEIFNNSNTTTSISFDYRLLDPSGIFLTQGSTQIELQPTLRNSRHELTKFRFDFTTSGEYELEVRNINGANIEELIQGSVFVPPSIRLRATQSLQPYQVVPLEGVSVNSNIHIEGVDGE